MKHSLCLQSYAVVFAAVLVFGLAGKAEAQTIYYEDFDYYSTGSIGTTGVTAQTSLSGGGPGKWSGSGGNVTADASAVSSPNDLQLTSGGNVTTTATNNLTLASGNIYTESFDLTPLVSSGNGDIVFQQQDQNGGTYLFKMLLSQNSAIDFYNSSGSPVASGATVAVNNIYKFTITYNATTATETANVMDVTTSTSLLSNYSISYNSATPTQLWVLELNSDGYGGSASYDAVDNISIAVASAVPEPPVWTLLVVSALALYFLGSKKQFGVA